MNTGRPLRKFVIYFNEFISYKNLQSQNCKECLCIPLRSKVLVDMYFELFLETRIASKVA